MCSIQITRIYPIQTVITPWMPVAKILVVGSNFSAAMFKQKSWPRYKKRHDSSIAKMLSCETCLRIWLFKTVCKTFLKKSMNLKSHVFGVNTVFLTKNLHFHRCLVVFLDGMFSVYLSQSVETFKEIVKNDSAIAESLGLSRLVSSGFPASLAQVRFEMCIHAEDSMIMSCGWGFANESSLWLDIWLVLWNMIFIFLYIDK